MHPYLSAPLPHLFGHRGASGEAPENTLPAFELALAQGVPFLETDCHATRDGEIVLLHDPRVERVTDGRGAVQDYTLSALEKLDAGFHFSPDAGSFPHRGRGLRIPRLRQLLEAFPEARINLEIKQADPPIVAEVIRILEQYGATHRVLLAAGQDAVMADIRSRNPGTAIGCSQGDVVDFVRAAQEGRLETFEPAGQALQIPARVMGQPLITEESVAMAHQLDLLVHVWTINETTEMRRLLDLGVDGLMSDFPERLVRVVRERAAADGPSPQPRPPRDREHR